MRYTIFDVETPNFRNDRMSALGITVMEDGLVIGERYFLINPETYFDSFNIRLTGITPESVRYEPTFADIWPEVEPMFSSGLLIAHNAPFDMGVLSRCLNYYGIYWRPETRYACTCAMGRRLMPELPNHRLNTMCDCLNIELDHHNAASDSHACAMLLKHYLSMNKTTAPFERTYDIIHCKTV